MSYTSLHIVLVQWHLGKLDNQLFLNLIDHIPQCVGHNNSKHCLEWNKICVTRDYASVCFRQSAFTWTDVKVFVCVSVCLDEWANLQEQRCCKFSPFTEIKVTLLALTIWSEHLAGRHCCHWPAKSFRLDKDRWPYFPIQGRRVAGQDSTELAKSAVNCGPLKVTGSLLPLPLLGMYKTLPPGGLATCQRCNPPTGHCQLG